MKFIAKFLLISLAILSLSVNSLKLKSLSETSTDGDRTGNCDNPNMTPINPNGTPQENLKLIRPIINEVPQRTTPNNQAGFGNFSKTCRNYKFDQSSNVFSAECKTMSGSWKNTSIDLNDCYHADRNNRLTYRNDKVDSKLNKDCNSCTLNIKALYMDCTCNSNNTIGIMISDINLNVRISNQNGNLTFNA